MKNVFFVFIFLMACADKTVSAIGTVRSAPQVRILTMPAELEKSKNFSFTFDTSSISGIEKVECSLDGSPFFLCISPVLSTVENDGQHIFIVRITDKKLSTSTTIYSWIVDSTLPTPFSIFGITGDYDIEIDNMLSGTEIPIVHWQNLGDAQSFDVYVYDQFQVEKCAQTQMPADSRMSSFSNCYLDNEQWYIARVFAYTNSGNYAFRDFSFKVISGR